MKPLFSAGPFTVYFFGLMIGIGALVAIYIFLKEVKRRGFNEDLIINGVIYAFIGGIIGARLIYVFVYNPGYYLTNPIEIFFIHQGGLSIHGGLLGGILVGYFYLKKKDIPVWEILDIVAPAIILAQGISRIGCDVFGGPISESLPWGIEVGGEYLHPAQAYEFLLDYILFGYLWIRLKKPAYSGQVFLHYLIGYMVIRGTVEFTRINPTVFGLFSVSHVMSVIGIIFAAVLMMYRRKNKISKKGSSYTKIDYLKVIAVVVSLMIVSLVLYYWVQG